MKSMRTLFGLLLTALVAASSPAAAGSLTVGLTGSGLSGSACQPFTCPTAILTGSGLISPLSWTPDYQQVYASRNFASTTTFTGIAFLVRGSGDPAVSSVNGGTFKISLSTTSAPVLGPTNRGTGLNTTSLSANLGSDNVVVYNGPLPAISNGMLKIVFTTPFSYNPSRGNLLLDVQSSNSTDLIPFLYLALGTNKAFPAFSLAWVGIDTNDVFGYRTTFFF